MTSTMEFKSEALGWGVWELEGAVNGASGMHDALSPVFVSRPHIYTFLRLQNGHKKLRRPANLSK